MITPTERKAPYLIQNNLTGEYVVDYRTRAGNARKAIFTTAHKAQETIQEYLTSDYSVICLNGLNSHYYGEDER